MHMKDVGFFKDFKGNLSSNACLNIVSAAAICSISGHAQTQDSQALPHA